MIRFMQEKDFEAVLKLETALFPSPWHRQMWESEWKDNAFAQIYVLETDAHICGYIDFWITFETAQLARIAVASDVQGHGLGSQLMDFMIEECERAMCENISLEVRVDNQAAIMLYERYGFIRAACRKGYYEDGSDGHLMIKPLGGNYV